MHAGKPRRRRNSGGGARSAKQVAWARTGGSDRESRAIAFCRKGLAVGKKCKVQRHEAPPALAILAGRNWLCPQALFVSPDKSERFLVKMQNAAGFDAKLGSDGEFRRRG